MTFKQTVLQELLHLIRQEGLAHLDEQKIIDRVDISSATFREFFNDMNDLVTQVVQYDLESRKEEHERLFQQEASPLRRLLLVVQLGLKTIQEAQPTLLQEIQEQYPAAWNLYWRHSNDYSAHLLYDLLNAGVLQKELRQDLNIQLVTKIMLEQLSMIVNPVTFPPERFNVAEVFRSVFLYYIRGICTDEGVKKAEQFFASLK
ncbi:TetR/AcrR family transcriptional regulator [Rufibacter sediminis]|uniref:TetR/AcrR family transcriptional regulator n=1 Tax=Rufibacter sediminis TaxID=2762756 RepID=A0ABR6VQI8_9BACT|nr:TetR/AcrR family transcriptional regulator [Rufibacter sediminis]MBC3539464.1 TetR/AcrR family transcriptional regulator [Rufibacter sediminis]